MRQKQSGITGSIYARGRDIFFLEGQYERRNFAVSL